MTFLGLAFAGTDFLGYNPAGGWIGASVATMLRDGIAGTVGSYLIVTILFLLSLIIISTLSLTEIVGVTGKWSMYIVKNITAVTKYVTLKSKDAIVKFKESRSNAKSESSEEPVISSGSSSDRLNGKQSPVDDILNEEIINLEDE